MMGGRPTAVDHNLHPVVVQLPRAWPVGMPGVLVVLLLEPEPLPRG